MNGLQNVGAKRVNIAETLMKGKSQEKFSCTFGIGAIFWHSMRA